MIRSLFDTEDEKKESEKVEDKINQSPPENLNNSQIVEPQPFPAADTIKTETVLKDESAAPVETRKEEILENQGDKITNSDVEPVSDFESEKIFKDNEFGDNFLELEKEVARIEQEVRLESDAKIEEEIKTLSGNQVLAENSSATEKSEPTQNGIFTAAINKSGQEKKAAESLENLLIMPSETPPVSDVSSNEKQSFILPDRIEPAVENTALTQTSETANADYKPESKAEIIRKSGLAWSAGIAFFGSVMFLLILGWFAGLLLGNSTWGAVGGVVLGSIIGFLQLFRLTSQILKNNE